MKHQIKNAIFENPSFSMEILKKPWKFLKNPGNIWNLKKGHKENF